MYSIPMDISSQHYRRKIQELTLLFEISQLLDGSPDIKNITQPLLESMAENMGMHRGTITLVNRNTQEITIQAGYGMTDKEISKGIYHVGEGITGKVVQTGEPVVVPNISRDPQFLDKTGTRGEGKKDLSFICVPIKIGKDTVGTLSADRLFADDISLDEDVRLLSIVASMISQALKLRQQLEEDKATLLKEKERLQKQLEERFQPSNIIGNSQAMQEVYDLINQVSRSEATVLIRGQSGTGKELVAHAIHYNSFRADKPFIKVNCAALPESIIESELFGHEKGAFTGAMTTRKGRFELADGGTIFLDEIGELTPMTQVKLLRVLQEREIERVGGVETIKVNVRVVTATNRSLEEEIEKNTFREDLFYRLNVFPIHIPPLKDRKSDIMLLADHFVEKYSSRNHKEVKRISSPAIDLLMSYHWPGNVRELENCMERSVLLSSDQVIHSYHLPPSLQSADSSNTRNASTLQEALDQLEEEMIREALKTARGNRAKAARELGLTERIIGLRVEKFQIDCSIYKTKMSGQLYNNT
jgi:Nif-specific regulatory protein